MKKETLYKTNHKNKKKHFSGKPPTIKDKTTTKAK
jgi:hypothetical protein